MADPQSKHILVFPIPPLGHIVPMLNLCSRLTSRGITHITVLIFQDNTELVIKIHEELVSKGDFSKAAVFKVEPIFFSLPPPFTGSVDEIKASFEATANMHKFVEQATDRVLESNCVPISFVLSDFMMTASQDLADKLNVPRIVFKITGFQELGLNLHMPWLISRGIFNPLTEIEDDDLDKAIDLPGFPKLKASDISQFPGVQKLTWERLLQAMEVAKRAKIILVNSCHELEGEAYESTIKTHKLPIHLAGPLLASPARGLDHYCLRWLETQPPRSVLFASFGSFLQFPASELENISLGIEASGKKFLLALRMDAIAGDSSPALLSFFDRYKTDPTDHHLEQRKGLIVPWAPQREVLLHPSIGGFFTHYGWNSMLESIAGGVPVIGKPILGDHFGARRLALDCWRIGVEINEENKNKILSKDAVERAVNGLFSSQHLYANAAKLKKSLEKVVEKGGSSYHCWDMLAKI